VPGTTATSARYTPVDGPGSLPPPQDFSSYPKADRAYVALLYTDGAFVLGARVLGQSLRDNGTDADLVVLVSPAVSQASRAVLAAEGWQVRDVGAGAAGMSQISFGDPKWDGKAGVLDVFRMYDEYDSVIFLDADALAVSPAADAAFACPSLCLVQRHSERFNSGVLAMRPTPELAADLDEGMARFRAGAFSSYEGGDQGLLNEIFADYIDGPVLWPPGHRTPGLAGGKWTDLPVPGPEGAWSWGPYLESRGLPADTPPPRAMRLSSVFNDDMILAALGGRIATDGGFAMPASEVAIVHYTAGPLKPWQWWSSLLVSHNAVWMNYRRRLPSLPADVQSGAFGPVHPGIDVDRADAQARAVLSASLFVWMVFACACLFGWIRQVASRRRGSRRAARASTVDQSPHRAEGLGRFGHARLHTGEDSADPLGSVPDAQGARLRGGGTVCKGLPGVPSLPDIDGGAVALSLHRDLGGWSPGADSAAVSVLASLTCVAIGAQIASAMVPAAADAALGAAAWTCTFAAACGGSLALYLRLAYGAGRGRARREIALAGSERGAGPPGGACPWVATLLGFAVIAAVAVGGHRVACPPLAQLQRPMVARSIGFVSLVGFQLTVTALASAHLAPRWYFAGRAAGLRGEGQGAAVTAVVL